jgi:hypothetical protein
VNLTRCQVDTPCWQYAELHEILHDLGAVQPDAPTPSAAWHCTDEADVMCYDDGSGPTVVTTVCPPSTRPWSTVATATLTSAGTYTLRAKPPGQEPSATGS